MIVKNAVAIAATFTLALFASVATAHDSNAKNFITDGVLYSVSEYSLVTIDPWQGEITVDYANGRSKTASISDKGLLEQTGLIDIPFLMLEKLTGFEKSVCSAEQSRLFAALAVVSSACSDAGQPGVSCSAAMANATAAFGAYMNCVAYHQQEK